MSSDRLVRAAAAATVAAVAGFAAVVSYSHIYDLGRAHGQSGAAARLLPLSVDGLILAASLVLLHEARADRPAPGLARSMLWLGVGATVAANVAYGAAYGPVGMVVSAWPAVAFVGAAEMIMGMARRASGVPAPAGAPGAPANGSMVHPEAARVFSGELAAGSTPSLRRIRSELGVGQDRARRVQAELRALAGR